MRQIIQIYSQEDDKKYIEELMSAAFSYSKIDKKKWEETKVTTEVLDIKVDLMLLLRKERIFLEHLANRIKGNEESKETESDTTCLKFLKDMLIHEDTLFFDLRGRDFEYQERIDSNEVIKMLYIPPSD